MKTLKYFLILSSVLIGTSVFAEKMKSDTQDLVINKMERLISNMDKKDSSYVPSQQRLADLLAERARIRFMSEVEANCDGCNGSKADRQKAIKIYESLLAELNVNEHGPVLFQLAHLYQMAGQMTDAQRLYETILKDAKKKKINALLVAKSHVGLADLLFAKAKFKDAHDHYVAALRNKELDNRSLITYNKAWCEFNQDQLATAIVTMETMLAKPELITRDSEEGSTYDASFHADLMRDLSTFYSRRNISDKEINTFERLAPAANRKALLLGFADEASRLGQKQAANTILNKYLKDTTLTKEERLQAFVTLAQVNYDRGNSSKSTEDFAKAAAAYQDGGCDSKEKCAELQKTMKRYVTELHRSKKLKPDPDLLNAYQIYVKTFPSDIEMIQRGAQVAMEMNMYPTAIWLYRSISSGNHADKKQVNESLLNEVAAAEKSKDVELQKASYNNYLKNSSDEVKKFEVSYQLAYLFYTNKQLKEAAVQFNDLALNTKGNMDLRKKSADLAMDSLVQLKDDVTLEQWAWTYSEAFPKQRAEFETLARKALMNRVALAANNSKTSKSELSSLLGSVLKTKVGSAKNEEKILFYTNVGVLAQKTDDEDTYVKSQLLLIEMPSLSREKKDAIRSQLASYYEKKLNFKKAYELASSVQIKKSDIKETEFRLGTLADLANIDAQKHYRASLKAGLNGQRSLVVRTRLVLISSDPVSELKKQARDLKANPDLLNDTALFVFAKTGNKAALNTVMGMKELRNQSASRFILSQDFYSRISSFQAKLAAQHMNAKNSKSLQRSTTDRVALLNKADTFLNESVKIKDITGQMLALNMIANENNRLVKELAALPGPVGLTAKENQQYVSLFKAKLKPFLYKAKAAEQRKNQLWATSAALSQLVSDYKTARPEIQRILVKELSLLAQIPGEGTMKSGVEDALSSSPLSTKDLQNARQNVAANPDSIRDIENLKMLETKIGHPLMPAYLEARISHLQKGKRL